MLEENIKDYLSELVMNVPLTRGLGDKDICLQALSKAVIFYPVFADWPSPVLEWLDEAEEICHQSEQADLLSILAIRRAVVYMRQNELDKALQQVDLAITRDVSESNRVAYYAGLTMSRIYTRQHEYDKAQLVFDKFAPVVVDKDDWLFPLKTLTQGELLLETNNTDSARGVLLKALQLIPKNCVEDRVQVLQSLGFLFISLADVKKAVKYLEEARKLLKGAGVGSELIQMNLTLANFYTSMRKTGKAEQLFAEALHISQQNNLETWEAILQLGMARTKVARTSYAEAIDAGLKATMLFAKQGNSLAYTSMIIYLSRIYSSAQDYKAAYRTLVYGLSIAQHLNYPAAELIVRTEIDKMKNQELGEKKFEAMVEDMLDETTKNNVKTPRSTIE